MVVVALRGLFAGAGSAMMSSSLVVDAVLQLTRKPDPRDVRLLYLGELRHLHEDGDVLHAMSTANLAAGEASKGCERRLGHQSISRGSAGYS